MAGKPGNNRFASPSQVKKPPHKKFSGGIVHDVWDAGGLVVGAGENLLSDVANTVIGIPAGLVVTTKGLATDPVQTGKAIAQSVWSDWSPLFHGEFKEFARNTYDHPLAPLLDVASVLTLGGAGAVKGASVLGKVGVESRAARALLDPSKTRRTLDPGIRMEGSGLRTYEQHYSANPVTRMRQKMSENAVNHLAGYLPSLFNPGRVLSGRVDMAGLSPKQRADAMRWGRQDAYYQASHQHAAAGAGTMWLGSTLQAARRLNRETAAVALETVPHAYDNLTKHAARVPVHELITDGKYEALVLGSERTERAAKKKRVETEDSAAVTAAKHDKKRLRNAELAHSVGRIQDEIDLVNEDIAFAERRGSVIAGGVRTAKGRVIENPGEKRLMEYDAQVRAALHDRGEGAQAMLERSRKAAQRHAAAVEGLDRLAVKVDRARESEAHATSERERIAELEPGDPATLEEAVLRSGKGTLDSHYQFIHKDGEARLKAWLHDNPDVTPEQLADFFAGRGDSDKGRGFGGRVTTKDAKYAARDEDGNFLVTYNHSAYASEAANSTLFLAKLGRGLTTAWKWAVLGMRPAFLLNNAIGNMFMYWASMGPAGARGLYDAMRQLDDTHKLTQEMSRLEREAFRTSHEFQNEYYLGLHRGYAQDASQYLAGQTVRLPMKELKGKKAKFIRVAGTGLYDITHEVSDRFLRRAAINAILRKHPEVQAEMKKGMHFDEAARMVSAKREVREAVQEQVNNILGQYHYLNPTERAIRAVVPFYTWDRAIARHGAHLYLDRPTTARMMTELGAQGVETTEEMLGQIPDFLRSALPLSLLGLPEQVDGRIPIMGTTGMNPYSSIESLIKTLKALTTGNLKEGLGEALSGQLHPAISAGVEQSTGRRLLTGAPLPAGQADDGLVGGMLRSIITNLPQAKMIDVGVRGPQGTPESMYKKDFMQYLSAYLGLPFKQLNPEAAAAVATMRGEG